MRRLAITAVHTPSARKPSYWKLVDARGVAKHAGVKEPRPMDPFYMAPMSYRHYRSGIFSLDCTPLGTSKVRDCIKRMALAQSNHYFRGEDPILVLDFLAQFVSEADIVGMSEGQAHIALPYFLQGVDKDHFLSIRGSPKASKEGVT